MAETNSQRRERLLEEIADWNDRVALADHRVDELIIEALAARCTHEQIGISLGISRQGVTKRIERRKLRRPRDD